MKVILSRKGFDSQYGKQPSPILPDGTLLSLPIPSKNEVLKFGELYYEEKTLYQIIKELNPKSSIKENYTCHLDPDIRYSLLVRDEQWKPIFGQSDAAQGHLLKQHVCQNDIFLFYGWFRKTEFKNNCYSYIKDAPDLHVIFGYLQVGEIFNQVNSLPDYAKYHPHTKPNFIRKANNCIYVSNSILTINQNLKGSSPFEFNERLVLTKSGLTKSKWELPSFFKYLPISYHRTSAFKEGYFQSAAKGQEFVIEANVDLIKWVKYLLPS